MLVIRLALGTVRRGVRDFTVYYLTLALAACLLYSFIASGDYLLALDLTPGQRASYLQAGGVLSAFSVLAAVVFAFLVGYADVFLVRRRAREFGLLRLCGMGEARVAALLVVEGACVGAASLATGIALGWALSPVFGFVAAFVFGTVWRPSVVFSASAAAESAVAFLAIELAAARFSARRVHRTSLVELMGTPRRPEPRPLVGRAALRMQRAVAVALLAAVWGCCVLSPGYFIIFIVPMGFMALGGTYLLFRVLAAALPARLRVHPERYLTGLVPFAVRQVEARAESSCAALAAVCVLLAAGMCLIVSGLSFSIGLRGGELAERALALAPVAYAAIFYGACFLVVAAAVLSLRQLAQSADDRSAYRILDLLGAPRALAARAAAAQIALCFAVPVLMALVHCVFGFTLIGLIMLMMGAAGFAGIVAGTVVATVAVMALYCTVSVRDTLRHLPG